METTNKTKAEFARSECPVANFLDLLGDKWTLLIVRDLLLGKRRYGEFARSEEGIPTNLLAARLKRLEQAGIVQRQVYCEVPVRHEYHITDKGRELRVVVDAMAAWANENIPGVRVLPDYDG